MLLSAARAAGIVAAAAVLVAATGCGPERRAGAPAVAGPAGGAAQRRLDAALLTVAELPLGFEREDAAGAATAIGCPDIDRLYLNPGTARASVSFGHTISDTFVHETISVQPGSAAAEVTAFARAPAECRAFTGGQRVAYRVTALTGFPRYGDASAAVRVTAAVREARPVELAAVRLGDAVLVVANADAGRVDTDLTGTLTARAVAKLRRTR